MESRCFGLVWLFFVRTDIKLASVSPERDGDYKSLWSSAAIALLGFLRRKEPGGLLQVAAGRTGLGRSGPGRAGAGSRTGRVGKAPRWCRLECLLESPAVVSLRWCR